MSAIIVTLTDGWAYRFLFCTGSFELLKREYKTVIILCSDYYYQRVENLSSESVSVLKISKDNRYELKVTISLRNYLYRIYHNFKISKFYLSKLKLHQRFLFSSVNWIIYLWGNNLIRSLNFFLNTASPDFSDSLNSINAKYVLFLSPYSYKEVLLLKSLRNHSVKKIFILPSWDNIYKYYLDDEYDKYIVWGHDQKKLLAKLGFDSSQIYCLGSISQYIFNKIKYERKDFNSHRKFRILYATVTDRIFPNELGFVKELANRVESDFFGDNVELFIRMHPADKIEKYISLESSKVLLSRNRTTYSLTDWEVEREYFLKQVDDILSSNVVITVASTMTLDSVLLDRYTINFRPSFCVNDWDYYQFEHYESITSSSHLPILDSLDKICLEISNLIRKQTSLSNNLKNSIKSATLIHEEIGIERYFNTILD